MENFYITAAISKVFFMHSEPGEAPDDDLTTLNQDDEEEEEGYYQISGGHRPKKQNIGTGGDVLSRGRRYIQNIQSRGSGRITVHDLKLPIILTH